MPKQIEGSERKKLLPIRILQILEKETDFDHPLTQDEIIEKLINKYDISAERKAVGRNIQLLQDMFDKDFSVDTPSAISIASTRKGCYIEQRIFEDSELHLLIDSVLASKHICSKHAKDLIEKVSNLSNKYFKTRIKHVYSIPEWDHTESQSLFINIDTICNAIEQGKQVKFDYNKYGTDKKLHKTKTHIVSPYAFVMKNQKYYLMYGDERADHPDKVSFMRVDKISNIKVLDEKLTPIKKQAGYESGINYKKITCSLPYLFNDKIEKITFVADSFIVDYIVDDFGKDVSFTNLCDDKVKVTVMASPKAMEFWAMQYLKHVEIKSPASLRDKIKENIKNAVNKYE